MIGRYASVNGMQMYYEVHGAGRPLVLLHGGLLTIDLTFGPIIIASLAEHHQVIAVELQGHGHTADIDREMSLDCLAGDVLRLLGQLGIGRADFFGFSLGGLVALAVVMRQPSLANRLVLASTHYRPDGYHPEIFAPQDYPDSGRMPTEHDFQTMEKAYLGVAPDPEHFAAIMAKTSEMVTALKGWHPSQLQAIEAPTLIMVGDTDFVRLEHAAEMFGLIPNGQLAVLPGTTHMGVMQNAERVLSIVEPFLVPRADF